MAFIRTILSSRPLLAHAAFGASSAVALAYADSMAPAATPELSIQPMQTPSTELLAAALVGALQGATMRFWYPTIESIAHRRSNSAVGRKLVKIAIDAAPALLSTAGVNQVLRWYYRRAYGILPVEDSLWDRYWELADRVAATLSGAVSDFRNGPETEEFEILEMIIDTTPTFANVTTAAVTVLNFTIIPRQYRGLVGTLQWQVYEAMQFREMVVEEEGEEEGEDEKGLPEVHRSSSRRNHSGTGSGRESDSTSGDSPTVKGRHDSGK